MTMVVSQVEKEFIKVARRSTQSLLRQRNYNSLSSLDFVEIVEEMKLLCPTTFNILPAMIRFSLQRKQEGSSYGGYLQYHNVQKMARDEPGSNVLLAERNASQD